MLDSAEVVTVTMQINRNIVGLILSKWQILFVLNFVVFRVKSSFITNIVETKNVAIKGVIIAAEAYVLSLLA